MSEADIVQEEVERLEWDERKQDPTPQSKFRQFTRRTALTGGAAGIAAVMLEACGGSSSSSSSGSASAATGGGSAASGIFGSSKALKFTIVNPLPTKRIFH